MGAEKTRWVESVAGWSCEHKLIPAPEPTLELYNQIRVSYCSPERRKKCDKEKTCSANHLNNAESLHAFLRANKIKPTGFSWGGDDAKQDWKQAEKLKRELYKQCTPVQISIIHDGSG